LIGLGGPAYRSRHVLPARSCQPTPASPPVRGRYAYESHWKGKVSGLAMPPNAVVIKQAEARQLVKWILSLDAAKKP